MIDANKSVSVAEAYERYIGIISPSAAMFMSDWMDHYPEDVAIYAFQEAARKKIYSNRYIERIMESKAKPAKSNNPDKYVNGKYGGMVIRNAEDAARILARRKEMNESKT
jgi:hypothetical protein